MKIVIIGAGEVGFFLAKVLSQENHGIVMIDQDPARLERIDELLDVQVVEGHGASAPVLEVAQAFGADLLLAVTSSDEVNLLGAFLAKKQGAKRTVVRIKDTESLRYHRKFYQESLDIDFILVPTELCAEKTVELVRQTRAVAVETFGEGKIQMRRMKIPPDFPWVNRSLSEIKMPRQTLVAAVIGEKEIVIPGGDTVIDPGEELLLIGRRESMRELEKLYDKNASSARSVILVGGGELGLTVARSFEYTDIRVKLVEDDLERAKKLSEELDGVMVINGDGTDTQIMTEVGVAGADVFISASGDDERNLMSCQLAKALGAKRTIAIVEKPSYVEIYEKIGIDVAISPRQVAAEKVLRYVRSGLITSIAVIAEGKAEVVEMKALAESKIVGTPLSKVGFPSGAIIGSILRGKDVIIPTGDDVVQAGDICIIFTFLSSLGMVEKMFVPRKR
jgi:trk system potassium uptake protein TrkA